MELKVNPEYEPEFQVGSRVWVISGKRVFDHIVMGILFEFFGPTGLLCCTGYLLDTLNLDEERDEFYPSEVYSTEEIAKEFAVWHPVELSTTEWELALGVRENESTLDGCELARCCANVSAIRDILIVCQTAGGLLERDVRKFRFLMAQHEYPMPDGNRPVHFDKIVEQLWLNS